MKTFITILALSMTILSCEDFFFEENMHTDSPQANFEYLWNECDRKYSYFQLKQINWDSVKVVTQAKISSDMGEDSLFAVLGGMLTTLRDDHANLFSHFNTSRFGVRYKSQDNFDWRTVVDNYIGTDYFSTGGFRHDFIQGENIAYVRYASFQTELNYGDMEFILDRYKNAKGIVLDIRENGGGRLSNVYSILSFLHDNKSPIDLHYSILKNGPGHNDFTEPKLTTTFRRQPIDNNDYSPKPVVLLTDRGTYSAGSFFSLSAKAIDNIVQVGDTTGGGLGVPNGGQLPNGWTYRFSISQTLDLNFDNSFENGVPPDHFVALDPASPQTDEILEKAIELLSTP